jgi:hypothetical protein
MPLLLRLDCPRSKRLRRRPKETLRQMIREDAYARLRAVNGVACLAGGMTTVRLAAIAETSEDRVFKWIAKVSGASLLKDA